MTIKEKFIRDLTNELYKINERLKSEHKRNIDVCFLVSVVDQRIEECEDFMNTISKYKYVFSEYEEDHSEGYTNGKIKILIEKPDEEKESECLSDIYYDYCYCIEFLFDERYWGYCQCSPEDDGYDAKHDCCGCSCDFIAPAFEITKEYNLGYYSWNGLQKDYWEYEKKFKIINSENVEELEKLEKERIKKRLEEEIERLKKRIASL